MWSSDKPRWLRISVLICVFMPPSSAFVVDGSGRWLGLADEGSGKRTGCLYGSGLLRGCRLYGRFDVYHHFWEGLTQVGTLSGRTSLRQVFSPSHLLYKSWNCCSWFVHSSACCRLVIFTSFWAKPHRALWASSLGVRVVWAQTLRLMCTKQRCTTVSGQTSLMARSAPAFPVGKHQQRGSQLL